MLHKLLLFIACLLLPAAVFASNHQNQADEAYAQKNYTEAVRLYRRALAEAKENDSTNHVLIGQLFYNLGNCHYRMKDYGNAVLCYQRTLKQTPSDEDAAFNLELTQAKLTDRFDAPAEMFFVSWFKKLIYSQSSSIWGLWAVGLMMLSAVFLSIYYLAQRIALRKTGFFGAILCGLLWIGCQTFAYLQNKRYSQLQQAVVLETIDTFDSPTASAKKQQILHEGTTVIITDNFKGGWLQIELPDGQTTWIKGQGIEKV